MNWNYDTIKKGLSSAARVAASAVGRAAEVAKDLAEDLTSFKALKDYRLAGHVATAGPCGTWRIFLAVSKKPGAVFPEVCVWILDKKTLMDQASRAGRARAFDTFFEQQRRACAQMLRIKHPGVVRVLEPMEESGGQLVMVTEPIFGSLHNVITAFRDVPTAPEAAVATKLSQLEVKYGLAHLAEAIQFLHSEARLAHSNLNPETVIITKEGSWKLAGFAFVGSSEGFGSGGGAGGAPLVFEYSGSGGGMALWDEVMQPPIQYTAPELIYGASAGAAPESQRQPSAADVFSLGVLSHDLLTGRPLLPASCSLAEYKARVGALSGVDVSGLPPQLQATLRSMLSPAPLARPAAAAFASCQWFQEDVALRALRFLDTMLQREPSQKIAFIKDLATFWQQFDDRLLRHKVLPPIVAELRGGMVQLAALPLVLAIMGRMSPEDFEASGILPVLRPIFETAEGELQLALVRNVGVFQRLMKGDATNGVLIPLLLRACDTSAPRAQEEVLRSIQRVAQDVHYDALRGALVPKVVAMCLRTTSLVVRTAALGMLSGVVHRLDRDAADKMMDVCLQITAVDKSSGTALAILRLGDAISRHFGADATAQRVLPLIAPLLVLPGLTAGQFAAFAKSAQEMLERVRDKRVAELGSAAPVPLAAAAAAVGGSDGGSPSFDAGRAASAGVGAGAAAAAAAGAFVGGGGASWDTPLTSPGLARPAGGLGGGGGGGLGGWDAPPAASGGGALGGANSSGWDSLVSPSSKPAGAGAAAALPAWSMAAVPAASTSAAAPSPWQPSQQQQHHQQQPWLAGISPAAAAPDIFGSASEAAASGGLAMAGAGWDGMGAGGMGSGGLGGGGIGGGGGFSNDAADLFGGLALSPSGGGAAAAAAAAPSGLWGAAPQPQQPPRPQPPARQQHAGAPMALRPPPSASTRATGGMNNLFAGLSSGGGSGGTGGGARPAAAPAAADPFASADPFGALASGGAGGTAAAAPSAGGDPFAALLGGGGGAMRPAAQQQRPPQQQQQWGGTQGSLI